MSPGRPRNKKPVKDLFRVLDAIKQGAATATDVSEVTGIQLSSCRASLFELRKSGLVKVGGTVPTEIIVTRNIKHYEAIA